MFGGGARSITDLRDRVADSSQTADHRVRAVVHTTLTRPVCSVGSIRKKGDVGESDEEAWLGAWFES